MSDQPVLLPRPQRRPWNAPALDSSPETGLLVPKCRQCGHVWYPPSSRCPECLSSNIGFHAASGAATLWSWIVMHRSYFAATKDQTPYAVALVELAEGPRITARLRNDSDVVPQLGMPLKRVFSKHGADYAPCFEIR